MFTLVAYSMQRVGATAALTVVTPVADAHVTIDGNNIVVPKALSKLLGAYCSYGTGLAAGAPTLAQLQSPGLRRIFQQDISRMSDTVYDLENSHIQMYPDSPLPLDADEGLQAWTAHGALALGETTVGVFLSDGPAVKVSGEIRTMRFTSVCAPVTRVWTLGALAVVQQLPMGTYQVVGARVYNATESGLFRLIFTGYDWRPGGLLTHSVIRDEPEMFRDGNLGVWGTFDWMHLPRIEICSVLAAPVANPTVILDLIKVS
jgi:hypothetical protein